ncbi:hypothetical protein P4V33_09230 [Brevibacillus borstelensis]|uniref:hypothetical protein n=1 Tax=Brevibacillus borstelensis TaxID=45462 RepID=UPI002E204827|nr:hypothetical protein [Brevibacillus borstelensis]
MRVAIRQHLIDTIPAIEERCFEPHAAEADTPKPYLVIRQGTESEDTAWTGFRRIIEVWPYVSRTSFTEVDALADQIINQLDKQLLATETGEIFTCQYLGTTGSDDVDHEWDLITRGLRFAVLALQPANIQETVVEYNWLTALSEWTRQELGSDWDIYTQMWPLGYRRPCVLWRLSQIGVRSKTRGAFEVEKKVVGHVLGSTPNEEVAGVLRLVEGIGRDVKLPLNAERRIYMTASDVKGDYQADGLTRGQISLTLSRMTARPSEEAPLMQRVSNEGGWKV